MNDGTRTGSRNPRRLVLPLMVAAIVVVLLGVWWTKTIAFTASASVHIGAVLVAPDPTTYQNNIIDFGAMTDETQRAVAQTVAAARGQSAGEYVGDLTWTSDGGDFHVTARGRTRGAAADLANDAAEALAERYTRVPAFGGSKFTANVTRAE